MGFQIGKKGLNLFLDSLKNDYDIYAPVVLKVVELSQTQIVSDMQRLTLLMK